MTFVQTHCECRLIWYLFLLDTWGQRFKGLQYEIYFYELLAVKYSKAFDTIYLSMSYSTSNTWRLSVQYLFLLVSWVQRLEGLQYNIFFYYLLKVTDSKALGMVCISISYSRVNTRRPSIWYIFLLFTRDQRLKALRCDIYFY